MPSTTSKINLHAKKKPEYSAINDFINKSIKKGYDRDMIKQALLDAGWERKKVNDAFKNLV